MQALTLSFCTQWPVRPVDAESYWPPKKFFGSTSHYKLKDANLAIIYFAIGDLLSCFQSVFRLADNVAAGITCPLSKPQAQQVAF